MELTYTALLSPEYNLWADLQAEEIYRTIKPFEKAVLDSLDGLELHFPNLERLCAPDKVKIRVGRRCQRDREYVSQHAKNEFHAYIGTPLRFTAEWDYKLAVEKLKADGRYSPAVAVQNVCSNALEEVSRRICLALSIYLPGFSDYQYSYIYENRELNEINMRGISSLGYAIRPLIENKISPTSGLHVIDFLKWAIHLNGFWFSYPKTNIERALNYISHTVKTEYSPFEFEDFVWTMAALEALYCESTSAVSEKMRQRAAIAVPQGKVIFSKKEIGRLYDFRSRFLHGSLNVRNRFSDDIDVGKDYYLFSFANNLSLASALFVKTIHVAAERDLSSLNFIESIDD